MVQFKPDNIANAKTKTTSRITMRNILRVVRQVKYSPFHQEMIEQNGKGNSGGILDLVIFLNGIPVATLELKTDFTNEAHMP